MFTFYRPVDLIIPKNSISFELRILYGIMRNLIWLPCNFISKNHNAKRARETKWKRKRLTMSRKRNHRNGRYFVFSYFLGCCDRVDWFFCYVEIKLVLRWDFRCWWFQNNERNQVKNVTKHKAHTSIEPVFRFNPNLE